MTSEGTPMLRRHLWTKSALALGTAVALCAALAQQGAAHAAGATTQAATVTARVTAGGNANDFIVRCFFNKNIAPQNPIDNPVSLHDDNLYDFFGNMAGGTTTFPGIQSGDYNVTGATMEQNQLSPQTNCQDTKDTAAYWNPSPYMVDSSQTGNPTPWQSTNGCSNSNSDPCHATGANENFHMRVYYIPHNASDQQIPDGTIMITGFPNGCVTVRTGFPPPDCSGTSYPVDPDIITYACGADSGNNFGTPLSAWPYDCTKFVNPNLTQDPDDSYSDGQVAMVRFPYCWDGSLTGHFPAPNSPADTKGMPTHMVPGYVAPWIVYNVWNTKYNMGKRPVNDFAYPMPGTNCSNSVNAPYNDTVVQLEERIHLLSYGAGWGDPSSCIGDTGLDWNSSRNAESSNNSGDTKPGGDGDGDANVKIGTSLWVPYQCPTNVTAPDPSPGATTLSFACAHSGDTNCNIPLTSGPSGCGSTNGTCYVGAYNPTGKSYGWETLHADYWQTWQEASNNNGNLDNTLVGGVLTDGVSSDAGTFGDVVEDCVTDGGKCTPAFIVTSQNSPPQVYNTSGNP
jgi:hypothetical protein